MDQQQRSCVEQLRDILSLWPAKSIPGDPIPPSLAHSLTVDFDPADLLNVVTGIDKVRRADVGSDVAVIDFIDAEQCEQRATLRNVDGWKLQALSFQCPSCFGTGQVRGIQCKLCDGAGWGSA